MASLAELYADPFGGLELTDDERREDTWRDFADALKWLSLTTEADDEHDGPDPEWDVRAAASTFERFAWRFAAVGLAPMPRPMRHWEQTALFGAGGER